MSTSSTTFDPVQAGSTPLPLRQIRHVILICPDLHEVGGIGMLSRLSLQALQSYSAATGCDGQVWSYGQPATDDLTVPVPNWTIRYARGSKATSALWGLKEALGDARHTLVVAMHVHLAPLALPLVKRGAQLAVVLCGIEAWAPLSGLRTRALEHATLLLAISQHTIDRFKRANPVFNNKVVRPCLLGIPGSDLTVAHQPATTEPFALIVGRLSSQERYKGHDSLLEIWREATKGCPAARLVIVGDGDDRARLENKAKELGVMDAVSFLGKVSHDKLESLYRDCRFFVMPSSEEGFGLVFLEAMRAGKACIAGKGAAEEIVEDGVTGVVVPAQDRSALLTALTRLFRAPELCEHMGHAGYARYLTHFTQAHFEKRLLGALELQPPTEKH